MENEGFTVLEPEEITAEKITVNYLILQQLNRINFNLSVGLTNTYDKRPVRQVIVGVVYGLRSIESMMANVLSEEYYEKALELKRNLDTVNFRRISTVDNAVTKWFDLLVGEFHKINLIPLPEKDFDFEP